MLRQQFKLSGTLSLLAAVIFIIWSIFDYVTNRNLYGALLLLSYGLIFLIVGAISFRKMKKTAVIKHTDSIYHHKKFIIEKEISLFNQLIIYSPDGALLGRYRPNAKGLKNKLLSLCENYIRVLPFPHVIEDANGKEVLTIDIKGMNNPEFVVYDHSQEIGRIKQHPLKSLTKYVFGVTLGDYTVMIQSEAIIDDLNIPGVVHVYTDKVPMDYSKTFNQLMIEISEIDADLNTPEGNMGLAMAVVYKVLRTK